MFEKPVKRWPVWQIVVGLIAFFLHYTGLLPLTIGHAAPLFFLPLLITVSMDYGEAVGTLYGLAAGLMLDSVTSRTVFFHTIFLTVAGLGVGWTVRWLVNRNLPSAAALAVLLSALYFGSYWICFFVFPDVQGKTFYLLQYALPSAFYTSLLIFPFYLIPRWLTRRKKAKPAAL